MTGSTKFFQLLLDLEMIDCAGLADFQPIVDTGCYTVPPRFTADVNPKHTRFRQRQTYADRDGCLDTPRPISWRPLISSKRRLVGIGNTEDLEVNGTLARKLVCQHRISQIASLITISQSPARKTDSCSSCRMKITQSPGNGWTLASSEPARLTQYETCSLHTEFMSLPAKMRYEQWLGSV